MPGINVLFHRPIILTVHKAKSNFLIFLSSKFWIKIKLSPKFRSYHVKGMVLKITLLNRTQGTLAKFF